MHWNNTEERAKELAGNWQHFESFWWARALDLNRPQDYAIVYTHSRDSDLLTLSNAEAISEILAPFFDKNDERPEDSPFIIGEHHGHWGVGHVDGYAILVYDENRQVTPVFEKFCEIQGRLSSYPVLDEEDFSRREYEATLRNIEEAGRGLVCEDAPEDWPSQCFSWFWDNDQGAVECVDGGGGYPSDEEIRECLLDLGLLDPDEMGEDELLSLNEYKARLDALGQTLISFNNAGE